MQRLWCLLFIISSFFLPLSARVDSITITKSISINQTMISAGGVFALGFFTAGNSTNSYLGIWYNMIPKLKVIWVANRASPVPKGLPPVFRISEDGNLVVLSGRKVVWTSNVSVSSVSAHSASAVLLDNGNLVLRHGEDGDVWQSFDHPTDTYVSEMQIGFNKKTGQEVRLTSWVNDEDPRPSVFSMRIDSNKHQVYIWKGDEPYWRSKIYATTSSYIVNDHQGLSAYFTFHVQDDGVTLGYTLSNNSVRSRVTLSPSGQIQVLIWEQTTWRVQSQAPISTCDFYGYCGPFTVCQKNDPISVCNCLSNFQPKSKNEWSVGNWTGGCVRNKTLSCDKGDGFLRVEGIKLPDHAVTTRSKSVRECEIECLANCSCTAYAYQSVPYEVTIVCLNWFRELVDIECWMFIKF